MTRHLRPGLLGERDKSSVIQCRKTPDFCDFPLCGCSL
jgi:hypothetical protein